MPAFGSLHSLLEAWWFALGSLPSISALSLATSAALPSLAACPPSRATAAAQASTPPADSACSWPQRTPLRRARLRSRLGRAHQYCVGRLLPVQHMDVGARVWGHSSLVLQMPRPKCLAKRLRRDRALMTTQENLGGVSETRRFRPGEMAHTWPMSAALRSRQVSALISSHSRSVIRAVSGWCANARNPSTCPQICCWWGWGATQPRHQRSS